jgi:ribulose-phosphate 3-epimerase
MAVIGGVADSFHFDVADAHFTPTLLLFPDLVRALRPLTAVPFHVHLMVAAPGALLESFLAAGADLVTVHVEVPESDVRSALGLTLAVGCCSGIALKLDTPVEAALPFLDAIDAVLLLGTAIGIKGQELSPAACDRIRRMKSLLAEAGRAYIRVIADGAVRTHTAPLLRAAGADVVVPGSLVFSSDRPTDVLLGLRSLA